MERRRERPGNISLGSLHTLVATQNRQVLHVVAAVVAVVVAVDDDDAEYDALF